MSDEILLECNSTELRQIIRRAGLGVVRKDVPLEKLISIVRGIEDPAPEHLAETMYTRKRLELFIEEHWGQVRSQLPGCTGKCCTYPCTETKHVMCLLPNLHAIQ